MSKVDFTKMDKYIDGVLVKEGKPDEASEKAKLCWWRSRPETMAADVQGTIKFIQSHQPTRLEQLTMDTRLYSNSSTFNFIGPALSRTASTAANSVSNRISFNLCASVIDTLVSKIAKNKVVPTFITSGGVWGMQKKAEQLSKFTEGLFYDQDVHTKGVQAFRDGAVWGTGILHIYQDEDNIKVERAMPHEFFVDQVEAITTHPQQLHRVKVADRDIIIEFVKNLGGDDVDEKIEAVRNGTTAAYVDIGGVGTAADLVTVTESWHLPSGKDATDGLHVICCGDKVLFQEEWKKTYFPFVFFHYNKRLLGFWGQGACERLQNLQQEINRLMILIQRSMWMGGSFKVLVENGSKIVSQHLNNDVGAIIHYSGTPPQYITPPMIQQDIYPYVDALIAKGYQQEGVSQLAASSLKPQGVDSGAALRAFDDIADDRFLFIGQQMEEFYLEVARQMIEVAKEIATHKKFLVKYPGTMSFEEIDWKDIKLKEDEYVLKAYPTSSLPEDPAGRLQTVQEYAQAGFISPHAARRLLAMPDIEMSDKLANAAENNLHRIFEDILDKGEYVVPEPTFDLQLASMLYLEYYNFAALNNCPEDRMELLRQFKAQVDDLVGLTAPPPMPQVQAPANPTPTPTSPMLPNVNPQGGNQ